MAAEETSISRAAARLNISQPAVSRQIRDLEEEFGVALFERDSSGLRLTEAGQTALTHARDLLRRSKGMTDAVRRFADAGKRVQLRIGYLPTALPGFLANGLRLFNQSHDHVCVQIREMTPSAQEEALAADEIDLALLGHACPELKKRYRTAAIRKTSLAATLPDNHRLARRKSIDLVELSDDPFLTLDEKHFPGRPEMMRGLFEKAQINPEITLKVSGLSEILGLIGSGAGVAILPADLEQLSHAGVAFVALKRPKVTLVFSAAWRKDGETPELLDLVDLLG